MDLRNFDLRKFVSGLKGLSPEQRNVRLEGELERTRGLEIRDPLMQFQQQLYIRRLEKLLHFFEDQNLPSDLTPSEKQAYGLLADEKALVKP